MFEIKCFHSPMSRFFCSTSTFSGISGIFGVGMTPFSISLSEVGVTTSIYYYCMTSLKNTIWNPFCIECEISHVITAFPTFLKATNSRFNHWSFLFSKNALNWKQYCMMLSTDYCWKKGVFQEFKVVITFGIVEPKAN